MQRGSWCGQVHPVGSSAPPALATLFLLVCVCPNCMQSRATGLTGSQQAESTLNDLRTEATLMAKLRHPHVCLYFGACMDPPCLVMEYCSNRSLDIVLKSARADARVRRAWERELREDGRETGGRGCQPDECTPPGPPNPHCALLQLAKQLTWVRLLTFGLDAAKGMLYLHTRVPPVVHRDLKSANLLVDGTWHIKARGRCRCHCKMPGGCAASIDKQFPPRPPQVADFNLSRSLGEGGVASTIILANPRFLRRRMLSCVLSVASMLPAAAHTLHNIEHAWHRFKAPCQPCLSSFPTPRGRWLAPEVLGGQPGQLPADVWAFGCGGGSATCLSGLQRFGARMSVGCLACPPALTCLPPSLAHALQDHVVGAPLLAPALLGPVPPERRRRRAQLLPNHQSSAVH